jgi:hypothetical protein
MSRFEEDVERLRAVFSESLLVQKLPSGAHLLEIRDYRLETGWSVEKANILFVAPPAYPIAQPDCFWLEPSGIRLTDGRTPQNTNDANPIPEVASRPTTWFSWHLQAWNPNSDSLLTYFNVIEKRLNPAR